MSKLSHIDINVSNYKESLKFYNLILPALGWKKMVFQEKWSTFCDGSMKICVCAVEDQYEHFGFHRKRIGLNHLAFKASSKEEVDIFFENILLKNDIPLLYEKKPSGDDSYYAVFFEDPDRIKIEVVFAPRYCDPMDWTNQFSDNFDPYS